MFPALAHYLPLYLSDTGKVEALSTDEPLVMQLQGILGPRFVLHIEVHPRSDGKHIFGATEVPENRGTSITNGSWSENPKGNEGALKSPQL